MSIVVQRRKSRSTEEDEFQADIIREAERWGYLYYHTHDSRKSPPGFPDLVLVKWPRLLFIECKSRRGVVKDDQAKWLAQLGQFAGSWAPPDLYSGAIEIGVCVWRAPGDWGAILNALGVHGHQPAGALSRVTADLYPVQLRAPAGQPRIVAPPVAGAAPASNALRSPGIGRRSTGRRIL